MKFKALLILILCAACGSTHELNGSWGAACTTASASSIGLTFDGASAIGESIEYSSNSCTTKERSDTVSYKFIVGSAIDTPAGATALDLVATDFTVTAFTDAAKTQIQNECTGLAVTVGTPVSVAGNCGNAAAGTTIYSVYKLDSSTSPKQLFLGLGGIDGTHDGTTAAKRHNSLTSAPLLLIK